MNIVPGWEPYTVVDIKVNYEYSQIPFNFIEICLKAMEYARVFASHCTVIFYDATFSYFVLVCRRLSSVQLLVFPSAI